MTSTADPVKPSEVEKALLLSPPSRSSKLLKWVLALALLGTAAIALDWMKRQKPPETGPRYETSPLTRGSLHVTVTATGTLSARDSVPVGAEISGRVVRVYVDFNDKVKKGQILAEIDPEQYRAKRDDSSAQLALARASRVTAEATERETTLKVARLSAMKADGLASAQDVESGEAAMQRAKASVASAAAQITSAGAALKVATSNLGKTVIRSPIDGIVLERSVEPGQTVIAAMQTPVVFTLAADLSEMRLAIKVDEADVGQVKPGQRATFTVDAYPNRAFDSAVLSVKNMPTTTQNVVTYETRLSVRNDQGLLRPGMTATATILVEDKSDVWLVPNAALRFVPQPRAAKESGKSRGFSIGNLFPKPPGKDKASPASPNAADAGGRGPRKPTIYVWRNGKPAPLTVEVGSTDGIRTEVSGAEVLPELKVILAESTNDDD